MSDEPNAPARAARTRRRHRRSTAEAVTIAERLAAVRDRHAGSDAERRAAHLLAGELREGGRRVEIDTFWVRLEWRTALAVSCALGVVASLLSVTEPEIAFVLLGVVLAATAIDLGGRWSAFRALTPVRATQNVVSPPPGGAKKLRLIVTAATDVPRRGGFRRIDGPTGGRAVWLVLLGLIGVGAMCLVRARTDDDWVDIVQLVPTFLLLGLLTSLLENRRGEPFAGSNAATGAAAAIALAARLDARPPRNIAVEVVLAGAGDSGGALGLDHRLAQIAGDVEAAVLHIEPCASGTPCWWRRDGLLTTLPLHPEWLEIARWVAEAEPRFGAREYRGRGATGALAARRRRFPALAIGGWTAADPCSLDADPEALRTAVEFAHALVVRLDRTLDRT